MLRSFSIAALTCLTLASVSNEAAAQKDNAIAVLGLEVRGKMDMATAKVAKKLTDGLRNRAKAGGGPFILAANSSKDLAEVKLLNDCEDEGKKCMAAIGKELGATVLLYGNVTRQKSGYQVSLTVLDTSSASTIRTVNELVKTKDNMDKVSRSLYNSAAGIQEAGALRVGSDVEGTTVTVDGKTKTTLEGGSTDISNLSEGEHVLVFDAPGYDTMTRTVTVKAGDLTVVNVSMTKAVDGSGGESEGRPGGTSRVLFWTSAAATVAVGGFMAYNWFGLRKSAEDDIQSSWNTLCPEGSSEAICMDANGGNEIPDACDHTSGMTSADPAFADLRDACDRGQRSVTLAYVGWGLFGATSIAASYFFYKGYVASGDGEEKEPTVRITPSLSHTAVGAGLSIDF
jgi:TolB-like protein